MKLRVYAVLDKAVQAYLQPLVFRAEGEALRAFYDAVSAEGTPFAKHKHHYAFCFLGYYDDNLGTFMSQSPVAVAEGATIQAMMAQPEEEWTAPIKPDDLRDASAESSRPK